jgi:putative hydrolase of the HAD superfamily
MSIKAVAFDVDGTLYPNAVMYRKSLVFAVRNFRRIRAYARVRKVVRKVRPIEDLKLLERQALADELGIGLEEASRFIDHTIHEVWEQVIDRVDTYPGVRECCQTLIQHGLRLGVSSDFPVSSKLKRLGVDDLFQCALWSEDSGYLKPHPEPFLALASCLDADPSEMVFVGNSYEYDVEGAKAAGMRAVHLARHAPPDTIADFTTNDFESLTHWILDQNGP